MSGNRDSKPDNLQTHCEINNGLVYAGRARYAARKSQEAERQKNEHEAKRKLNV